MIISFFVKERGRDDKQSDLHTSQFDGDPSHFDLHPSQFDLDPSHFDLHPSHSDPSHIFLQCRLIFYQNSRNWKFCFNNEYQNYKAVREGKNKNFYLQCNVTWIVVIALP